MKKIFELNLVYTNGKVTNLLFSEKENAEKELQRCSKGSKRTNGTIKNSFIITRILF